MKIELRIDNEKAELQQKESNNPKTVSQPLYDTETLYQEDFIPEKYYTIPHIFYYTNNLDFKDYNEGVEFFHYARGHNTKFLNKDITVCEDITNIDVVKGFYNRFDLYHIAWEVLDCDSSKREEIIKRLSESHKGKPSNRKGKRASIAISGHILLHHHSCSLQFRYLFCPFIVFTVIKSG